MNIEVVSENAYARKVQITVPAADVGVELDKAYKTYERRARLPGFRKGRVPRRVLEARFGPGIAAEVAEQLVQRGWMEALRQHEIEPVGRPALVEQGEVVANTDFAFTIGVEVKPEVTVGTFEGLTVEWPEFELGDDLVQLSIDQRVRGMARLAPVEDRAVESGDTVQVALKVTDGDEVVVDEPGTLIRTGGEAWLKGVEALLLGVAKDGAFEGEVTFADDARNTDVAGKTLQASGTVLSIQTMTVPELSDSIAKELGHDSVDAFKAAVRAELEEGREEQSRNQARANLLQALIDANPIDVPNGMVEQNLDLLKQELRYQAAMRGQDPKSLQFRDEQLADLRQRAVFAARGALLLEALWVQQGLEITDEEFDARIAEMAAERDQSPEVIKGFLARDNGTEEFKQRLLEEKTLDWLLSVSTVTKVSPQEQAAAAAAAAPAVEAAPEAPAAEAEAPAPATEGADLSILDGAIKDLKAALETGAHDAHLDALIAAETEGRARKGALTALNARK